ncbi:MAG: T9SS type A sorting domain-containing protein, partial [Chitinophaga rupis]
IVGFPGFIPGTAPSYTLCASSLLPAGIYTVRLDVFGGGWFDSATQVIKVIPTPHPVITKTGNVLSVPAAYQNYKWYKGITAVAGATNPTFTYTLTGTYKVTLDSGGCPGSSNTISTVGVNDVASAESKFWTSQQSDNMLVINAEEYLAEQLDITISDQAGRQVDVETWVQGTNKKQVSNSTNFAAGLYLIRISNKSNSTVLKWIKQ